MHGFKSFFNKNKKCRSQMTWIIGGMMSSKQGSCLVKILGLRRLETLNNGGKKQWKYFKTSELQITGTKSYSYDVFPTFTKYSSIRSSNERLTDTVWNFKDFCITQILREINFVDSRIAKTAVYATLGAVNFVHFVNFRLQMVQKFVVIKIKSL